MFGGDQIRKFSSLPPSGRSRELVRIREVFTSRSVRFGPSDYLKLKSGLGRTSVAAAADKLKLRDRFFDFILQFSSALID